MGIGGVSPGSLLLVFLIVILLFGTKKLRSLGEDLGSALQGFKKGMREADPNIGAELNNNHSSDNQQNRE